MRQSEQVVLRDTSGGRQPQIKEKEDWAPIVTLSPFLGYIVAPPGPITHIHIQKLQQYFATSGIDTKAAKPKSSPGFCWLFSLLYLHTKCWTTSLMTGPL